MVRRVRFFTMLFLSILVLGGKVYASSGMKVTNEMIYTKLLEIEKRQAILEAQFREFKEQVDKRFEQVDKRFEELREDMNKRFEQVDRRFEQLYTFLWIITGIFTTLTLGVIGFAYWDRRTVIRKAREESVEEVERRFNLEQLRKLIDALRELAREDEKVARVLRQFGLL
jgi:predicted PurR-regulated permease PerM